MTKPTLIVVDDVKALRDRLHAILQEDFDIVAEAEDGAAAVEAVRQHQPQLVVMDIAMPKLSGIEAARAILQGPGPKPKIVIVSGMKDENIVFQAFEAGVCDYLFKPVDADMLIKVLQDFARQAA